MACVYGQAVFAGKAGPDAAWGRAFMQARAHLEAQGSALTHQSTCLLLLLSTTVLMLACVRTRRLITLAKLAQMLHGTGDQSKLDPSRQPICLLLGGGMAAGKSTVRKIIGEAEFWTRVCRRQCTNDTTNNCHSGNCDSKVNTHNKTDLHPVVFWRLLYLLHASVHPHRILPVSHAAWHLQDL